MEDFDKIKYKIKNYHSSLNIEEEWNVLSRKKESTQLKKRLRHRNGIIAILGFILIVFCGYSVYLNIGTKHSNQLTNEESGSISKVAKISKEKTNMIDNVINQTNGKETSVNKDSFVNVNEISIIETKSKEEIDLIETTNFEDANTQNFSESSIKSIAKNRMTDNQRTSKLGNNTINNHDKIETIQNQDNTISIRQKDQRTIDETNTLIIVDSRRAKHEIKPLSIKSLTSLALTPPDTLHIKTENLITSGLEKNKYLRKGYLLFELFGQGGFYSFNYGNTIYNSRKTSTDVRIGISINPKRINGNETGALPLLIPMSINQSFVKDNHSVSLGAGLTLVNDKLENEPNFFYLFGNIKFEYKYRPSNKRVFYKAEILSSHAFEDIFTSTNRFKISESSIWGAVGIGYTF